MARGCRTTKSMGMAVSTIVLWLIFPALCRAHAVEHVSFDSSCPPDNTYVYPYGSHCSQPARFFTEDFQLYHKSNSSSAMSVLEPEWDETNSTYYVRLAASSSASYTVLYNDLSGAAQLEYVYQNFPALLQNADSKRYLAWREEGVDEHFLIETTSFDEAATFWFFKDEAASAQLPCILLLGARCEAYNLLSLPRDVSQAVAGWLLYEESGVDYIKLAAPQSRGDVPILLGRISTNLNAASAAAAHGHVLRTHT